MTVEKTFDDYLNRTLQLIKSNEVPFGGVSVMACGDFLQLPPVMDRSVFQHSKFVDYNVLAGNLRALLFKLLELKEVAV